MSFPIRCIVCGDIVGVSGVCFNPIINCPGAGRHKKPTRTEKTGFFGLLKEILIVYSEVDSHSTWVEYIGPRRKLWLWLAVVFGTHEKRVTVNGKWAWFNWENGLFGDGVAELRNVSQKDKV